MLKELIQNFDNSPEVVNKLESLMLKEEQVDCPVIHTFGPNLYVREVHIPKGAFAVGHKQKYEHFNVFLKGEVSILKDDGTTERLKAPMMFTGKPGRKIGFAHEDVVWLNIYATKLKDVEVLESVLLEKSDEFLNDQAMRKKMQSLKHEVDREDYKKVLVELKTTEELVQKEVQNENDLIDLCLGAYKIKLSKSPIHGKGLFATGDIEEGEIICPARINGKRTIAGRWTNHSIEPNAVMVDNLGDINLKAIKPIKGQRAGQDGDEIVINYRDSIKLLIEQERVKTCQE